MNKILFSSDLIEHYGSLDAAMHTSKIFAGLPEDMLEEFANDEEAFESLIEDNYYLHIKEFRKILNNLISNDQLGTGEKFLLFDGINLEISKNAERIVGLAISKTIKYLDNYPKYLLTVTYGYDNDCIEVIAYLADGGFATAYISIYKTRSF
jgi:hypothetical protein